MNAIELLKDDHNKVDRLFQKSTNTGLSEPKTSVSKFESSIAFAKFPIILAPCIYNFIIPVRKFFISQFPQTFYLF